MFSSNIPGSFSLPRTVQATAVLIAEPPIALTSRQTGYTPTPQRHPRGCSRPIVNVGKKLNATQIKLTPILNRFSKITTTISNVQSKISDLKSKTFQKLGLSCLFPKLLRPIEPFIQKLKCTLGLNDDRFMDTPPCNSDSCLNPIIENKMITRDRGLPNLDFMIEDTISTMDECFEDMEKVMYGSRILAKLVDDQPCDDPRFKSMCEEAMNMNRIIFEEDCESQG